MTRAAHAVGDRRQEAAAGDRGEDLRRQSGKLPGGERARRRGMTFAQAAQEGDRARRHLRRPRGAGSQQLNAFTKRSVAGLAGQGLMVAARDNYPRDGASSRTSPASPKSRSTSRPAPTTSWSSRRSPTVGTVLNPRSLQGQTFGGVMLGIGHAIGQKWVYDQHYGVPLAKRFHYNKPPTILDAPSELQVRRGGHPRSGNAGRRARHRRAAGRRGHGRDPERALPRRSATKCSAARR